MSIEGNRSKAGMFSPGEVLGATKMNNLAEIAGYGTTMHSAGAQTIQGPNGTVFMEGMTYNEQNNFDYPYKVSIGVNENGNYKVFVRAGTVNSFVSKALDGPMAGKYLDDLPAPYFDVPKAFTKKYVVLRVKKGASSKFFPTDNDVYLVDDLEALADSDDEGHLLLAGITQEFEGSKSKGIVINQYIYSSQALIRVKGSSVIWSWASR